MPGLVGWQNSVYAGFICCKCSGIGILIPAHINSGACILFRYLSSRSYAGCDFSYRRDA